MYFPYITHPVTVPVLRDGRDPQPHPVLIAGGGPTGLALALGLARYGIASVVLEADQTVCTGSRAACLSRRTLEIMAQLGVLDAYLAKGLPWTSGTSYYRGTEVFSFDMPHDGNQKLPPMINLQQCYAEQFLADAIAARASDLVQIRWGTRITHVRQDAAGVQAQVRTEDGEQYLVTGDWLVACDGARSSVRDQLGLRMAGTAYQGSYVIVDIELRTGRPMRRYCWFDPPSNPGSTLLMHKQPDDIWRLDYQLRPDEDPAEAVKPENVMPRVRGHLRMIGEPDDVRPVWISTYQARALTLDTYRHGRILFAGDAAHLVPIFGVRGMNSAIDDTHNLAWKLAFAARNWAPETLLDSYSRERVHAARENIRHAVKSTEFMAPPSSAFDVMRTAALGLAVDGHAWAATLANPRQTAPVSYAGVTYPAPAEGEAVPAPGDVLPECPLTLSDGTPAHLTDLLGAHVTALAVTGDAPLPPPLVGELTALAAGPVPSAHYTVAAAPTAGAAYDHTGKLLPLLAARPGTVLLIRPDGHLHARLDRPGPGQLTAALSTLLTREAAT